MSLVRYILTACMRDKLILSVFVAAIIAISLSTFLGSTAIVEQDQFVIVFAASSLRFLLVAGLTLFIVFFTRRSIDQRDLEYLISRPVTKKDYVFSHILAFAVISFFFSMAIGGVLLAIGQSYFSEGYILWIISLFFELMIVSSAAFFFAMVLSSAVSGTLATFAFYTFSRMVGQVIGIATDPEMEGKFAFLSSITKTVSLFIPRLDLFSQSSWLLYGVENLSFSLTLIVVQGIVFCFLLAIATLADLTKREF